LIQRELSDIVRRRVKDPRLDGLTITGTRISPDYQYADIHVYRLGGDPDELDEALQGLDSARGFIRRELGSRLRIRHTPELRFHLDESIDYGDRIESLLAEIEQERQAREDGTDGSTMDL
jgi:ribosome-binding factor A